MAERLDARQWAAWWQNPTLTSFQGAFENNYDGSVRDFWNRHFSQLPDDANIVDLGTGNGALALLAADYSEQNQRNFRIIGIDYADIQPASLQSQNPQLQNIHFLGNTPMEHTKLDAGSQNAIISQFGFEYGELRATLKEIKRLLKPRASHFIAMIHHENSAVLKQAREALQQITRCEKSTVAELARELIALQQQLASTGGLSSAQQQQAQKLHQQFTRQLDKLGRYTQQLKDPSHTRMFMQNMMMLFDRRNAGRITPEQRLEAISRLQDEQRNYRQRMRDLRSAAFSDKDFFHLEQELKKLGFTLDTAKRIEYAGQHFCNSLLASY